MAIDPMTAIAVISSLSKVGSNFLDSRSAGKAQRKNDRAIRRAGLRSALSGRNVTPNLVNPKRSTASSILSGIGTAGDLATAFHQMGLDNKLKRGQITQGEQAIKLNDLKLKGAQVDLDELQRGVDRSKGADAFLSYGEGLLDKPGMVEVERNTGPNAFKPQPAEGMTIRDLVPAEFSAGFSEAGMLRSDKNRQLKATEDQARASLISANASSTRATAGLLENLQKLQDTELEPILTGPQVNSAAESLLAENPNMTPTDIMAEAKRRFPSATQIDQRAIANEYKAAFFRLQNDEKLKGIGALVAELEKNEIVGNADVLEAAYSNALQSFRIASMNNENSGFGDMGLIKALVYVQDPRPSVVRGEEYDTVQKGLSLLNELGIKVERLQQGAFLTPEARQTIFGIIGSQYKQRSAVIDEKLREAAKTFAANRTYTLNEDLVYGGVAHLIPTPLESYNNRIGSVEQFMNEVIQANKNDLNRINFAEDGGSPTIIDPQSEDAMRMRVGEKIDAIVRGRRSN